MTPIKLCPSKHMLPQPHASVPKPKFIGYAHVVARSLPDHTKTMVKVNSNNINHHLSHGPSSNFMDGYAPNLLLLYPYISIYI